jgi:hypothetical protein
VLGVSNAMLLHLTRQPLPSVHADLNGKR